MAFALGPAGTKAVLSCRERNKHLAGGLEGNWASHQDRPARAAHPRITYFRTFFGSEEVWILVAAPDLASS